MSINCRGLTAVAEVVVRTKVTKFKNKSIMHPLRIDTIDQHTPPTIHSIVNIISFHVQTGIERCSLFAYLLCVSLYLPWLFICNNNLASHFYHVFFRLSANASKLRFDRSVLIVECSTPNKSSNRSTFNWDYFFSHLNVRWVMLMTMTPRLFKIKAVHTITYAHCH